MNFAFSSLDQFIYFILILVCGSGGPFHRTGSDKPGSRHLFPYFSRSDLPRSSSTFWIPAFFAPIPPPSPRTSCSSVLPVSFLSTATLFLVLPAGFSTHPSSLAQIDLAFLICSQNIEFCLKSFLAIQIPLTTTWANRMFLLFASDKEAPSGNNKYSLTC